MPVSKMMPGTSATVVVCTLLWTAMAGWGATLIDDPFSDGNRTNATGGDLLGAVWYAGNTGTLGIINDNAGMGAGNTLRFWGTNTGEKAVAHFNPVTLLEPGDTLRSSFHFRFDPAPTSGAWAALRVGLFNTYLTRTSADGSTGARNDDTGYGVYQCRHALLPLAVTVISPLLLCVL